MAKRNEKPIGYMVVWDDEQGLCVPMGADAGCDGALCCNNGELLLFSTRKDARRSIAISRRFALLNQAQGKPANDDFLTSGNCLKVLTVYQGLRGEE